MNEVAVEHEQYSVVGVLNDYENFSSMLDGSLLDARTSTSRSAPPVVSTR